MLKIMRFLLIISPLFFLIVTSSTFFPYVSGKSLLLRSAISLLTILFFTYFAYSAEFREQIISKVKDLKKNKLVLTVLVYFTLFTISTMLAIDKFFSFWGSPERSEGWVGIFFYILFFFLTLLLFEKKHWLWFFKISLASGLVLFIHALVQYFGGNPRPGSLIGNPALLATYFLFVIFSALVVFYYSKIDKNKFWQWLSGMTVLLGVIGIFLTGTRGAILGLATGILAILIYFFTFKSVKNFKKISAILFLLTIVFSGIFLLTRKAGIWQKVPGLNRVAQISLKDSTIQSRLIMAKISIDAVNPVKEGIGRFLFGRGWENYKIAWQKYYDPKLYFYDTSSFDRAHNKIFDVLVMNGILGLLAYLAIWFFYFREIFKLAPSPYNLAPVFLFFGVAFFIQNLFLFDHIASWIPFFVLIASAISYLNYDYAKK